MQRLENGSHHITIGTQPFSRTCVDSFGWGANSDEEQVLIKLAHEVAHVLQSQAGHEKALVAFLDGSNDIGATFHPYIELYALLRERGICNGLANLDIYHAQSRTTGNLNMNTLEDITEFLGAYLISDAYFLFRLEQTKIPLSQDEMSKIASCVIQIIGGHL